MSRVGKYPVEVPTGVTVTIKDNEVTVKGKLGSLSRKFPLDVGIQLVGNQVQVARLSTSKQARAMWGTARATIQNMVTGVSTGFNKRLEINGVGFRAAIQGKEVLLNLGYSHDVRYAIPEGISIVAEKPTLLVVSGSDRAQVGQVSAEIRSWREPEPYKGKGIQYEGEKILRKEGKKK
ncbi:MAG: 50S ribosomal protein L6 [Alphaproteobacteria bacterium]|nr:50S ribosomal protein L6 [Alphaproteobacteria bacterium]